LSQGYAVRLVSDLSRIQAGHKLLNNKSLSLYYVPGLLGAAFVVLAFEPIIWLFRSWSVPGYDSAGAVIFAVVIALFVWSVSSPLVCKAHGKAPGSSSRVVPLYLLLASFAIRLASQLLAINLLGALMLALDVFACGLLARLSERRRSVSPLLLSALFCFALPLEPLLQRSLGFALQQTSASGACLLLTGFYSNVSCEGVRILLDGVDVLVDLPCSGARVLILLLTAFFALAAQKPLSALRAVWGFLFTCLLALWVNTLRIVVLAIGLRHESSTGIDVMLDPWHSGIGLCTSALGIVVLLLWLNFQPANRASASSGFVSACAENLIEKISRRRLLSLSLSAFALFAAFNIAFLAARPLDISTPLTAPVLPLTLGGQAKMSLPLTDQETEYFATFGGAATRAGYGSSSLLLVRTTSPLRHMHTPDICFSASGHNVSYVGADFSGIGFSNGPVAVYRSVSPAGDDLRVRVQFVSASGLTTYNISEVVWQWLRQPTQAWTMVQTVSPWNSDAREFLAAVGRSLNSTNFVQRPI